MNHLIHLFLGFGKLEIIKQKVYNYHADDNEY